jgi:hypothetical protein
LSCCAKKEEEEASNLITDVNRAVFLHIPRVTGGTITSVSYKTWMG